jgi:hypothetical protein
MAVCTAILPVAKFDICAPETHFGQIKKLYLSRPGDDLTNWSSLTEWNTRLSNTTALPAPGTDAPIRFFHVVGSIAEPEVTEIETELGRKVYSKPKWTLTFNTSELFDENIAFATTLQQNAGAQFALWFETQDKLFGGNTGIQVSLKLNLTIPESRTELMKLTGTATWEGYIPEQEDTPFV